VIALPILALYNYSKDLFKHFFDKLNKYKISMGWEESPSNSKAG